MNSQPMTPARAHPLQALRGLARRDVMIGTTLALTLVVAAPVTEDIGDALQVVLPLAALACAAAQGEAGAIVGRYVVLEAGIKIPKEALGDHALNQRPDGGRRGFPSGHTAAATFGAVHLLTHCGRLHPLTRGAALIGAAFTGGSRIEAGRHNLWQTIAGALWGWTCGAASWAAVAGGLRRLRGRPEARA